MRLRLLFLLPLFLLFSQQALVLHELSHSRMERLVGQERQDHAPGHAACEQCVSLASVAGLVAPGLAPLALAEFRFAPASRALPMFSSVGGVESRSRGPPSFL